MSKGLEAFNKFCDSVNACVNSGGITNVDLIAKEQVEKELKESENYKAMYRLEHEKNQQLSQANLKMSKALEIIKNKGVNVLNFIPHFIISTPEYDEYQYYKDNVEKYSFSAFILTSEEFNLLKEVLL